MTTKIRTTSPRQPDLFKPPTEVKGRNTFTFKVRICLTPKISFLHFQLHVLSDCLTELDDVYFLISATFRVFSLVFVTHKKDQDSIYLVLLLLTTNKKNMFLGCSNILYLGYWNMLTKSDITVFETTRNKYWGFLPAACGMVLRWATSFDLVLFGTFYSQNFLPNQQFKKI